MSLFEDYLLPAVISKIRYNHELFSVAFLKLHQFFLFIPFCATISGVPYTSAPFSVGFHPILLPLSPTRGPFLESPDNFSGPESYFMCAMFALKTQILLALKAEQEILS